MHTFASRTAVTAIALFVAFAAFGQNHPAKERGFKPELVYDMNGFDTVNTVNGNLSAAIPLGDAYPVGEGLSYSFVLRYTGNMWDEYEDPICVDPEPDGSCELLWSARGGDNAGFGWRLTFGRLFEGITQDPGEYNSAAAKWRYETPDGGEHLFWQTLHEPQCVGSVTTNCDPVDPDVLYTRDNAYLRLRKVGTARILEFPDGRRHRFEYDASVLRLKYMYTAASALNGSGIPTNNFVAFTYTLVVPGTWNTTVTDSHGRSHYIRMLTHDQISEVDVAAPHGGRAVHNLEYTTGAIKKPCYQSGDPSSNYSMDSLDRVLMPPSVTGGTDRDVWRFAYRRPVGGCDDLSGVLEYAQLPTGAVIAWTYQGQTGPDVPNVVTVQTRTTGYMISGIIWQPVGRKNYTWNGYEAIQIDNQINVAAESAPVDWRTEDRVIQYRRYFWGPDFGLPYTTTSRATPVTAPNPDGSSANRYLSSEIFDCNPTTGVCGLDRVTYVRYEMDEMIGGGCTIIDPCRIERNRRVYTERTRYVSDGGRYADATYSRFDGLGHYRQTTTDGTFDSGNVRTTSTEFNPGVGNYAVNSSGNRVAGHTMLPSSAAWLLETFPETSVTEGSVTEKRQYCFDAASGLLLRTRVMGSTSPVASDFLTVYTRDSANTESLGSVTLEQRFGGNLQAIGTGSLCSVALPSDQTRIAHTYADGSPKTSQYQDAAGAPLTFLSVNNLIDLNTGRVTQSTDTGGVATAYDYDLRGRLKKIRPLGAGNDGATEYVYTNYTVPTAPAQVEMLEWNRAGNAVLGRSKWIFDQFGRVSKEKRLLANGTWNTRRSEYDGAGRRTHVSEAEAIDPPVYKTTYSEFDADGRPRLITPPDHTAGIDTRVRFAYYGSRLAYRTIKVKTASGYVDATTVETYDRQGRLWKVTEPSGTAGADVSTTYGYDAGSRLKTVSTAAVEGTQTRTFTYDGRGVLVSETHPEKGVSGNGTVTYSNFDASGRPSRKVDGSFDLRFIYDRAERLTQVNQGGARLWKEFTFGTAGVENGKLKTAIRHNHHDIYAINVIITETYTYGGAGGRVSQRDTSSSEGTIFRQNFSYDDRGRIATLGYPFCPTGSTCAPLTGLGTLTNTYTNGFLTAIPGYASSITYHPNGLVQDVTFPNGAHWLQDNDPWSMPRPSQIRTTGTSPTWTTGAYVYDGAGNITTMGSDSYAYDKVGRVTSGTAWSGTRSQTYTYDSFGNANTITTAGGYLANVTMTPSTSTNRLAEHPYDSSGNVTSTHQYNSAGAVTATNYYSWRYDPMGMAAHVMSASDAGATYNWAHVYTADDERIWTYDLAANICYWRVRDLGGKVLTEFVKNNEPWTTTTSYVYRDGSLLASYSAGRSFPMQYHAVDHLGSIAQTFRSNTGGAELYRHAYYPFGDEATVTTDGEIMRFTGHERDNNGTDYMHARFYGTRRGRFLSVDPVNGTPEQPQSWNRYTYVQNSPVNFVDPSGLCRQDVDVAWPCWVDEITVTAPRWTAADLHDIGEAAIARAKAEFLTGVENWAKWSREFRRGYRSSEATVWERFGRSNTPTNELELAIILIPGGKLTASFKHAVRALKVDSKLASKALHAAKGITGRGGADNVLFNKETGDIISRETGEIIGNIKDFIY